MVLIILMASHVQEWGVTHLCFECDTEPYAKERWVLSLASGAALSSWVQAGPPMQLMCPPEHLPPVIFRSKA